VKDYVFLLQQTFMDFTTFAESLISLGVLPHQCTHAWNLLSLVVTCTIVLGKMMVTEMLMRTTQPT
jgi:hypothetical protein